LIQGVSSKRKDPLKYQPSKIHRFRAQTLGRLEMRYSSFLEKILRHRFLSLSILFAILVSTVFLFREKMKFVMFPREESKEFALKVIGPEDIGRQEMADLTEKVENLFINDKFDAVVGFRTVIGESRRGGQVRENEANLRVEVLQPSEREVSLQEMISFWKAQTSRMKEFQEVQFLESWWSSASGSPIAIEIQENDDKKRHFVSEQLKKALDRIPELKNVEIERPLIKDEYALDIDRAEALRLGLDVANIAKTIRGFLEGLILYRINNGQEEVDVRLTSFDEKKQEIEQVLQFKIANAEGFLVPLGQVVSVNKIEKPISIRRVNFNRTTQVYADLNENNQRTPLELATYLENNVFPEILSESPTSIIRFRGEIEDSRESQSNFSLSVMLIVALIFIILIFLFSSLLTPIVIALAIPFGIVGVIWAFYAHGLERYGFFAVIGTLGMLGVVINDSIVMVDKLEQRFNKGDLEGNHLNSNLSSIREIAVSRLRPVILTTATTVAGVFPTAYAIGGYDAMLADMMLAMGWGLIFGTIITLVLVPILYSFLVTLRRWWGGFRFG
jgi:multidrug efflux pump subunit AcrB